MRSPPLMTRELLEYLKEKFPDRCPKADVPEQEKCALAGEQRVVAHLEFLWKNQEKNALKGGS